MSENFINLLLFDLVVLRTSLHRMAEVCWFGYQDHSRALLLFEVTITH
jgi:hypothetical protein